MNERLQAAIDKAMAPVLAKFSTPETSERGYLADLLEREQQTPEGPWLPEGVENAESFNRKWAQWLADAPKREAEIAELAARNSARIQAENSDTPLWDLTD